MSTSSTTGGDPLDDDVESGFEAIEEYLTVAVIEANRVFKWCEDLQEVLQAYTMCGWAERRLKNEYGDYCGTSAWNRVRNTLANLQLGARAKLVKMTGLDRGRDGIHIRFASPAFKVPVTNSKPSILAARTRIELHEPWVAEALELGMSMLEMARAASEHSGLKVSNITVSRYFQDEGLDKPKKTPARVYREKVDARVRRYFEKHGTLDRREMMEELALNELFLPWKTFCESYDRLLPTFSTLVSSSSSDGSASEDGHETPDTSLELDAPVIGPKPVVSEWSLELGFSCTPLLCCSLTFPVSLHEQSC